jgi:hypothetical protein
MSFGLVPMVASVASEDPLEGCVRKKLDSSVQNASRNIKRAESPDIPFCKAEECDWSASTEVLCVCCSITRIPLSVTRYSCPSHIAITPEEAVVDAELVRYRAQIHSELFD